MKLSQILAKLTKEEQKKVKKALAITVINFSKKIKDIENFNKLPKELQDEIKECDDIVSKGFQFLVGYKNRYVTFEAGGHWNGKDSNAKFTIENYGSHKYQWDGHHLRSK